MYNTFTLYQFNALSDTNKIALLEDNGAYLDLSRIEGVYKVGLFALGSFYVEVFYNKQSDHIQKLNAFSSLKRLDVYLELISIRDIIGLIK
jgi:hypothetical protein